MSCTLQCEFINFLNEGDTEKAIQFLKKNPKSTENLNELMPFIVQNLTSSVLEHKKSTFECASNVLMFIAENLEPTITILEFQRFVKHASDHVNFCTILDALQSCIMKIKNKGRVIDWCLDSFKRYIENLPDEADYEVDYPEAASDRIIRTYIAIIIFLKPLVQEAIDINSKQEGSVLGDCLLSFFIFLCGKPFGCLNKYINKEMECKELVNDIITQALCLTGGDVLYFLDIVSQREKQSTKTQCEINSVILNDWTHNISNMAYANFYFYVITKKNYWIKVPQVYNSYYLLETCAYFFKILLSEDYLISNGLIFMENIINRISHHSVNSEVLRLDIYTELFKSLINVMIYSNNDEQRKKGVHVFEKYVEIFNMEARYTIILYLYEIAEHSGLLSFITGMLKSFIVQCLDSNPRNSQFLGRNMELLLKKVCNLPHGSSSDIVEISDEIITALNLLRFLFIKDKNNETGIWDMLDMLKNDYLNPLREGIDLCRAHWRVKTKDLEKEKDLQKEKNLSKKEDYNKTDMEVTLTVGGKQLPVMPRSKKISICYQVLNGLDVMESILSRVNECINMNEKYVKKLNECIE